MKHVGYGRYDVEVGGQVVGRAVERPSGWEATGDMKGVRVIVHGHDSLESACMAIGRALVGGPGAEHDAALLEEWAKEIQTKAELVALGKEDRSKGASLYNWENEFARRINEKASNIRLKASEAAGEDT